MTPKVKLNEIVDYMQMQNDDMRAYLNVRNGKVHLILDEIFSALEDEDEEEELEMSPQELYGVDDEEVEIAREIIDTNHYIALPSQWDINEYQIMKDFALNQEKDIHRDTLINSLQGSGAFRRFKNQIDTLSIAGQWYKYRDEVLKRKAKAWCEEHGISYIY